TSTVEVPRSMPIFFESTAASIPDDPGEVVTDVTIALDAGDVRPEPLELAHDFLVAAVQVIDVVERSGPLGTEGGDPQRSTGPDVGHRDGAAAQHIGPRHDCAAALNIDVGSQLAKFWHVLEAVLEDGLRHHTASVGLCHQADERRLQVGRESWVRPGRHVDRLQVPAAPHPETMGSVLP